MDDKNSNPDWFSVYIASALSFSSAVQYTLYFSSLWPYLQIIKPTITERFFGVIIAMFSFGQLISSPLFGYFSNLFKQVKGCIIVGLFMMLIGNLFYFAIETLPFIEIVILLSRFIIGFGSSYVVLLRTYAATALPEKYRSRAIAMVTCGQAVGLTSGPALQLLFTPLTYPGYKLYKGLYINLYTAPAIFSSLMCIAGIVVMQFYFKEKYLGLKTLSTQGNEGSVQIRLPPYDIIALIVCFVTRFTCMYINTNLETIGSPYSMMMFSWSEPTSVLYTSIIQGAVGALTFLIYFFLIFFKLENYINYRIGSIISLMLLIAFHLITYPWDFISQKVKFSETDNGSVGCNKNKFDWCDSLSKVNSYLYFITYAIALGLAFPILNIGNTTLFSDIIGPRRQGVEQGLLQMSGSLARLLGPVAISYLYSLKGPKIAWSMEIAVLLITIILWIIFYKRIVPLVSFKINKKSIHNISVVDITPDPAVLSVGSFGLNSLAQN